MFSYLPTWAWTCEDSCLLWSYLCQTAVLSSSIPILFVGWSKFWKKTPLQKKHNANQRLVLLWKPHSWCSPWFNFYLCLGDISAIHFPYLPQVSGWSISCKFRHNFCCCMYKFSLSPYQSSSRYITSQRWDDYLPFCRSSIGFLTIIANLIGIIRESACLVLFHYLHYLI